jgi:hypothetical protein
VCALWKCLRDLFLKGGGAADHLFEFAMMLALGAAASGVSATRVG